MKRIFIIIPIFIAITSCVTTLTGFSPAKKYYEIAEQTFPKYVVNKTNFYDMPLNGVYDPEQYDVIGSGIDSATGATRWFIKNEQKTFDKIILFVNKKNKKVTKMVLAKELFSDYEAGSFYSIVNQKAKETYPKEAIVLSPGENDQACATILFSNTPESWKQKYSEYLEEKDRPYSISWRKFGYAYHPFLFSFNIVKFRVEGKWLVTLEYETKSYREDINSQHNLHI